MGIGRWLGFSTRKGLSEATEAAAKSAGKAAAEGAEAAVKEGAPFWKTAAWLGGIGLAGYGGYKAYQELFGPVDDPGPYVDPGMTPYQGSVYDQQCSYQPQMPGSYGYASQQYSPSMGMNSYSDPYGMQSGYPSAYGQPSGFQAIY